MKNFFNKFHIILTIVYVLLIVVGLFLFLQLELIELDFFILVNVNILIIYAGILIFDWITRQRKNRITQLENKIRENTIINQRKVNNEDIALNYLPVGILIYDDAYQISYANKAAKDYFSNVLIECIK